MSQEEIEYYEWLANFAGRAAVAGFDKYKPEGMEAIFKTADNYQKSSIVILEGLTEANKQVKIGVENVYLLGNTGLLTIGLTTAGVSALHFTYAKDRTAKVLYGLSFICSSTGFVAGTSAAVGRLCHFSKTAAVGDAFGVSFLYMGQKAEELARQIEGRPVSKPGNPRFGRNRKPLLPPNTYSNKGVGFVMPGAMDNVAVSSAIAKIPFEKIGRIVGYTISIYVYGKLIIKIYRYSQQLITKYKRQKIVKAARFLTASMYRSPSFRKQKRIARIARFANSTSYALCLY